MNRLLLRAGLPKPAVPCPAMATVYVETSIPSYYFETRRSPKVIAWREATVRWWRRFRPNYALVTSRVTLDEVGEAPQPKRTEMLGLLHGIDLLERTPETISLAAYYVTHKLVPSTTLADALHLAHCSQHAIPFLLTWNCRHLANVNKIQHLTVLNRRLGLPVPMIVTPLTLMPEEAP